MHIARLRMTAPDLHALRDFYHLRLGFPFTADTSELVGFQTGRSILEFVPGGRSCHHFAFNIDHDRVPEAGDWLQARGIELLPMDGEVLVPFPNWDAQAVYFHDPAGNVVEFIGRRRLPASGEAGFGLGQLSCISEIGLASFAHLRVRAELGGTIGLQTFGNPSETFAAMGDDEGLFIVVDAARKRWIPSMEPALPFPLQAQVRTGQGEWLLDFEGDKLSINPA